MKLWDHKTPIRWAYGDHPSNPGDIAADPDHAFMMDEEIVLFDNGSGVVFTYSTLAALKGRYRITERNPESALREVRRAMARHVPGPSELAGSVDRNTRSVVETQERVDDVERDLSIQSIVTAGHGRDISIVSDVANGASEAADAATLALEDVIPVALDAMDSAEANAVMLEELAPLALDGSEDVAILYGAIEDLATTVYEVKGLVESLAGTQFPDE